MFCFGRRILKDCQVSTIEDALPGVISSFSVMAGELEVLFERVPRAGRIEKIGVKRDSICCGGVVDGKGGLYRELSDHGNKRR